MCTVCDVAANGVRRLPAHQTARCIRSQLDASLFRSEVPNQAASGERFAGFHRLAPRFACLYSTAVTVEKAGKAAMGAWLSSRNAGTPHIRCAVDVPAAFQKADEFLPGIAFPSIDGCLPDCDGLIKTTFLLKQIGNLVTGGVVTHEGCALPHFDGTVDLPLAFQ